MDPILSFFQKTVKKTKKKVLTHVLVHDQEEQRNSKPKFMDAWYYVANNFQMWIRTDKVLIELLPCLPVYVFKVILQIFNIYNKVLQKNKNNW